MTDSNQPPSLAPIEQMRLVAELLGLREQLQSGTLSLLEQTRASVRALQLRQLLGASAVPPPVDSAVMATSTQVQKNGAVLVSGSNPAAMAAYATANFDRLKITQMAEGVLFSKANARLAEFMPTRAQTLASGAVIYEHGLMGGGVSVSYQGSASGVAVDLVELKGILAREWGPEKFRTVFGEEASAADVQAYQVEQQQIADRKAQNEVDAAERAAAPERERLQAAERAAAEAVETERIRNVREAEQRVEFERTTGAGVSANPIYQAFLDTQEALPAFGDGNAAFLGWAGIRAGEFEAAVGRIANHREQYLEFLRQYAEENLSERVRRQRAPGAEPVSVSGLELGEFPDTPEGKKELRAAVKAHLESLRGQMVDCSALGQKVEIRQRGIKESLAFSGNPKKLKLLHAIPQIISAAQIVERSENHKRDKKTTVEAYFYLKSTVFLAGELIAVRVVIEQDVSGKLYYDLLIDPPKEKAMLDSTGRSPDYYSGRPIDRAIASMSRCAPDHYSGHRLHCSVEQDADAVILDSTGGRLVVNLFLGDDTSDADQPETPAPAPMPVPSPMITEYKTKRGKVLRGIIRTDLPLAEARAIDPYAWRVNGGFFIRERYLLSAQG